MAEDMAEQGPQAHVGGVLDRRRMLLGAGAVGLTGVLIACGTDDGPADAGADVSDDTPDDEESDGPDTADDEADDDEVDDDPEQDDAGAAADGLLSTSDVPVGEGVILAEEDIVVTQPTAGEFRAFSATCTHEGCAVSGVADGTINCPCHGSRFFIDDGSVANGPATQPLPEVAIAVEGDQILRA